MDMNKILSAISDSDMSVDEFVNKLREQEHTNKVEAQRKAEEARLAAEAEKKARCDAEAKRGQFITDVANRALANQLTADDVAWFMQQYAHQIDPKLSEEFLAEAFDAETVDGMIATVAPLFKLFKALSAEETVASKHKQCYSGESKSGAKKVHVETSSDPMKVLQNFIKTIM